MFDPSTVPAYRRSHAEWAEIFGRKVIDGLIEGRSLHFLEHYARLAGSYARMHLEAQQPRREYRAVHPLVDGILADLRAVNAALYGGK